MKVFNTISCIAVVAAATLCACDSTNNGSSTTTPMTATETDSITMAVRAAIADDPKMSSSARSINITTDKYGVVKLSGTVPTDSEKSSIVSKAKSVKGVASVDNHLEVKS